MENWRAIKLSEKIFIIAGISTLAAIPFLEFSNFYLWLAVKAIYLSGLIALFFKK
jgi:hypothetical protein